MHTGMLFQKILQFYKWLKRFEERQVNLAYDKHIDHPVTIMSSNVIMSLMSHLPTMFFPSCRAAATQKVLKHPGSELLDHSPYSPGMPPCDLFLFPAIKSYLQGTHLDDKDELSRELQIAIFKIHTDTFRDCVTDSWNEC